MNNTMMKPYSPSQAVSVNHFKKKPGVQHVNKLTGKTDQGLKDKIREFETWQRYLADSRNELQRLNKLIAEHRRVLFTQATGKD